MRKLIIAILFIMTSLSCDKDEITIPECNVGSPIEEWLNEMKDNCKGDDYVCHITIIQGLYEGKPVFYTALYGALCDPIFNISLRDCNGDTIKEYKFGDQQNFYEEVKFVKTLFTCPHD